MEWKPIKLMKFDDLTSQQTEIINQLCNSKLQNSIWIKKHEKVYTINDVVNVLGVQAKYIIKSILMDCGQLSPVLAAVSGSDKINLNKLAVILGISSCKLMSKELVERILKIPLGAISPLTVNDYDIFIDEKIKSLEYMYLGTGHNQYSFKIYKSDLSLLENVIWANIT